MLEALYVLERLGAMSRRGALAADGKSKGRARENFRAAAIAGKWQQERPRETRSMINGAS